MPSPSFSLRLLRPLGAAAAVALVAASSCAPVSIATFGSSVDGGVLPDGASGSGGSGSGSGGGGALDGGLCLPGDVVTFHPTFHAPAVHLTACTPSNLYPDPVGEFFDACLGAGKSDALCKAFRDLEPDCASCLVTPESAVSYGPIISHGGFVTANVAGCIQVELAGESTPEGGAPGTSAVGCAHALDSLEGCELAACEANCPVSDVTSLAQFQSCSATAASAGCSVYSQATSCADPAAEAGVPSACLQSDFGAFYHSVAPLFCSPAGVVDAGKPAADAGTPAYDGATSAGDAGSGD